MGWVCEEDGHHEGYLVAVVRVPNTVEWRELTSADDDQGTRVFQAACVCGWRSARLVAPSGSRFLGGLVELPRWPASLMFPRGQDHRIETQAVKLWQAHTRELADLPDLWLAE